MQRAGCGKAARPVLWGAGLRKEPVYPTVISGNSTRWVAAVLLVIYLLVYVWLTFMYRKPSAEPKTRLIPFETYRAANQLNPFKIKRKIAF